MSAKHWVHIPTLNRRFTALIVAAWVTCLATWGYAEEPLQYPTAPRHPPHVPTPEECAKFPLTRDEYLDRLHAVAMNGDLRDAPFVAKTLEVTFDHPMTDAGGSDYFAKPKSSPYTVTLSVGKTGAALWMGVPAFKNCKRLTRAMVARRFPGAYAPVLSNSPEIRMENTTIHLKGKDVTLVYWYDDKNIISHPKLTQVDASSDK